MVVNECTETLFHLSLVELTKQRETELLEPCVASLLASLFSIEQTYLFKCNHQSNSYSLFAQYGNPAHNNVCIDTVLSQLLPDINQYILTSKLLDDTYYYFKIVQISTNHQAIVLMSTSKALENNLDKLDLLLNVYSNYSCILMDNERDQLTHLLNRKTFESKFSRLVNTQRMNQDKCVVEEDKREISQGKIAWLAIVDIDHFKSINDQFGHVCGDEVLLSLSQLMTQCFRRSDLLFRFGGEEFLIVLEPINLEDANNKLENFRKTVEAHIFPLIEKLTVSIGFTEVDIERSDSETIGLADMALYYAKENGRNSCYNFEQLAAEGKLSLPSRTDDIELF